MKNLLFALVVFGWTLAATAAEPLPDFLVGQWATTAKKADSPGTTVRPIFVYLLAGGRGAWNSEAVGLTGTARYRPATREVVLVTPEEGGPTLTMTLVYNLKDRTLTLVKLRSTDPHEIRYGKLREVLTAYPNNRFDGRFGG